MAKRNRSKKPAANNPASEASQGAERRRHRRARLNLLVQHRFETLDAFMEELAVDISVGGLFLRTSAPRKEGETVYLRFALADGLPLIEGIGKVVRVNPGTDPEHPEGMGIEFISLDEESRQLIDAIVQEKFVEQSSGNGEGDGSL